MPTKTKKILEVAKTEIRKKDYIFQKDLYESVGFLNGNAPHLDLRGVGMIGLTILFNFFAKIEGTYKESNHHIDQIKDPGAKYIENNFFLKNLLIIS